MVICLEATIGAALVVGARHHHVAAERLHVVVYPLVIRRHHHRVYRLPRLVVHTANHSPTAYLHQRFTWETARTVPSRYDTYNLHVTLSKQENRRKVTNNFRNTQIK